MFSRVALHRITWLAVMSGLFALATHLFFGSIIAASANDLARQVVTKDRYENGAHHFSGMVMVPSLCHELIVRARDLDADTIVLVFETWEQPYRECEESSTPRAFEVVAFAPEDISIRALLDGEVVPLRIVFADAPMPSQ